MPDPISIPGITPGAVNEVIQRTLRLVDADLQRIIESDNPLDRLSSVQRLVSAALTEGITFGSSELIAQLIEAGVDVHLVEAGWSAHRT